MTVQFIGAASADIRRLLRHSRKQHGLQAKARYATLLKAAVEAIDSDPFLIGSEKVDELEAVRSCPIRLRRNDAPLGQRVSSPRHILIYRVLDGDRVQLLAVVHDRMLLGQAASRALKAVDDD